MQTDGGSGSDDEDFSPKGRSGKNKRVMANRQSAQRSRLRKLQYIQDLENNVNRLQSEIGQIQPQLTFLRDKYSGALVFPPASFVSRTRMLAPFGSLHTPHRQDKHTLAVQPQVTLASWPLHGPHLQARAPTMNKFQALHSRRICFYQALRLAGLSSQNQKLRDRVAALLNEARYKESVNTSLKEEISRMIPMTGAAGEPQA